MCYCETSPQVTKSPAMPHYSLYVEELDTIIIIFTLSRDPVVLFHMNCRNPGLFRCGLDEFQIPVRRLV